MFNTSSVFSVNYQSRSLVAHRGCKDRHQFLVGTCSLHDANELSLLLYSEDTHHIDCIYTYSHNSLGQVLSIDTCPIEDSSSLCVVSHQSISGVSTVSLYRMPGAGEFGADILNQSQLQDLEELSSLSSARQKDSESSHGGLFPQPIISEVRWGPRQQILGVDGRSAFVWDCEHLEKDSKPLASASLPGVESIRSDSFPLGSCAWDPHNAHLAAFASNCCSGGVAILDTRTSKAIAVDSSASSSYWMKGVRSIDYNPNKAHTLVTAGDDRAVRVWDLRALGGSGSKTPLLSLAGHSHSVCAARYNPYHDQLLLSGGADNMVNLWRVASVSSSPWIGAMDPSSPKAAGDSAINSPYKSYDDGNDEPAGEAADVKVRALDEHEDSVYSVAWSASDAWVYASLSFDGRVIVNNVPSTEKYKILL